MIGDNPYFLLGFAQNVLLFLRNDNVRHRNTYAGTCGVSKAGLLDSVQNDGSFRRLVDFEAASDNFPEVFFADPARLRRIHDPLHDVHAFFMDKIFIRRSLEQVHAGRFINVREAGRENFIKNDFTDRSDQQSVLLRFRKARFAQSFRRDSHPRMQEAVPR